jgi:hypothetical protein
MGGGEEEGGRYREKRKSMRTDVQF